MHSVEVAGEPWIVDDLHETYAPEGWTPDRVVRAYLQEAQRMVADSDAFSVLAHIDYPVRRWPAAAPPFDPLDFEDECRSVLRTLARSGRALEVNTVVPVGPEIVGWWYDVGGDGVSFGSDAHAPSRIARRFSKAAAMVEAHGFVPGRHPHDLWKRRR